jgi:peptidoglycan/xylan/chitin deacetylase (PgdA/CDA1 family)
MKGVYLDSAASRAAHGIMFHHFHGSGHPIVQGSISGEDLADMIEFLGGRRTILPADVWIEKARNGHLKNDELCLTFDDGILGQKDVAIPVLDSLGITAIFCVYSSVFSGGLETLEIFRSFRNQHFEHIEDFYEKFFEAVSESEHEGAFRDGMDGYNPDTYLAEYPFYSEVDRRFRYARDRILRARAYNEIMIGMIEETTSIETLSASLWMKNEDLVELAESGHVVGLHSNSHPTALDEMTARDQKSEYQKNISHLASLLDVTPRVVAHPCNAYDATTLAILGNLGVEIGFRANMSVLGRDGLEFPREDHANILATMKQQQ